MITYFIQCGDCVKIGITSDINTRLKALRHASPFSPVVLNTSNIDEIEAHKKAGELSTRMQGEWFKLNQPLVDWISSLPNSIHGYIPFKRTPGRPATGNTKEKVSLTIDREIFSQAKQEAAKRNLSVSAWVEKAVASKLHTIQP